MQQQQQQQQQQQEQQQQQQQQLATAPLRTFNTPCHVLFVQPLLYNVQ
jgi:hypothetical protein